MSLFRIFIRTFVAPNKFYKLIPTMRYIFTLLLICLCRLTLQAVTQQEARAYITNRQYPQAVTAYRSLMQQKTLAKNPDCNKFFGQALCMTGAYEESIPYLEFAASKAKTGAWWYLGISRQHLYDFDGAIQALEKYRSLMNRNSMWLPLIDSIEAECQIGLKGISHVQDVVIIDSMIVSRDAFFSHYKLGAESGRVLSVRQCGELFSSHADSTFASVFENQAGDYRMLASVNGEGQYRLLESHLFSGEWSEPSVIASIDAGQRKLCYPFLRSDSETLFFACDSTPGFGGFDLYKTHYSTENGSYYTPERMPMPFNSPFDDYMMAIDETHSVGWWATNRNTASDMVCIYLFQLDDAPTYLDGRNVERARISSIAETWREAEGYEALVEEIRSAPQFVEEKEEIRIPINDAVVYTSVDQFRNQKAREEYEASLRIESDLLDVQGSLDAMRQDYHSANAKHRAELRNSILQAEQKEQLLLVQLRASQKKYRNLENK